VVRADFISSLKEVSPNSQTHEEKSRGVDLAILADLSQNCGMTQPLALFLNERLLPAGQLVNRLQDLGYRVQSVSDPAGLIEEAEKEKPLLVMVDLEPRQEEICAAIAHLKQNATTAHLPVIAFASSSQPAIEEAARAAGATLVVTDTAILLHLEQFLDQALQVE